MRGGPEILARRASPVYRQGDRASRGLSVVRARLLGSSDAAKPTCTRIRTERVRRREAGRWTSSDASPPRPGPDTYPTDLTMKINTLARGFAAAAALLLVSQSAHAQLGGALRGLGRRAQQAAANTVNANTPGHPAFSEYVLEITPERLDQLARGLAVEDTLQRGATERATPAYATTYQTCESHLASTDARYRALRDRVAGVQGEAYDSAYYALDAYRAPICGRAPDAKAKEIHAISAGAAGLGRRQYNIIKERAIPFCQKNGASGSYVYSAGEMSALRSRCPTLKPMLEAVM